MLHLGLRYFVLFATALPVLSAFAADSKVRVLSPDLNVRSAGSLESKVICMVAKGTELTKLSETNTGGWLKVKANGYGSDGSTCIAEGYVKARHVENVLSTAPKTQEASQPVIKTQVPQAKKVRVLSPDLNVRSAGSLESKVICMAAQGTVLTQLSEPNNKGWIKVKVNGYGSDGSTCIAEGYVKARYVENTSPVTVTAKTPPESECEGESCGKKSGRSPAVSSQSLAKLSEEIDETLDSGSAFLNGVKAMIANPKAEPAGLTVNRGLVQMPTIGNRGPCGSFNYNPLGGESNPNRIYANPLTACVFTSLLQEWKRTVCPNSKDGCRISFGDISRKNAGDFGSHEEHANGTCIDIRPMQKGAFENRRVLYTHEQYDQEMMDKFVKFLRKNGGSNIYFGDPTIRKANSGVKDPVPNQHDNHIHVCFKDNDITRNVCDNLKVDPAVCPELQ